MKTKLFSTIAAFGKLGAAGGIIFGIGALFLTQNPASVEVGPKPAQADIGDFLGAPGSESAKFTEAMVAMGLKPRAYDYNGNVMYFASGYAEKQRPSEVLGTVQEHLVEYGVNKKNHAQLIPLQKAARNVDWSKVAPMGGEIEVVAEPARELLTGDVVPVQITPHRVEMVGMEFNREFDGVMDLFRGEDGEIHPRKVKHMMGGYKYIDASWEPSFERSSISAVWSGEDFVSDRMEGVGEGQSPPDPNVPPCMGCRRDYRFQSLSQSEPFQANMWSSNGGVQRTYDFYKGTMEARGWNETGVQPYLDRIGDIIPDASNFGGKLLNLEKQGESLQLAIVEDPAGGVNVFTLHESEGAQFTPGK